MRLPALAFAAVAVLGCGKHKSKLDSDRGADADALWELAPDGTELGIVASPRAVDLGFRAVAALRDATDQADLKLAKPQVNALLESMFGSETATPEDAGYAKNRAFAMFVTTDGVLGVIPVGDRNKFMAAKNGKRGDTEDTLETNTCRQIGRHYVCVTQLDMFERIGTGKLRGKLAAVGTRGDAELYMTGVPLLGDNKGELMIAAQLEVGQASLHARWNGELDGPLAMLAGTVAPKPDTTGASGFVTVNLAPLLANAPALPVAGGVTLDQLAKSLTGPVTAVIPAGVFDFRIGAPLADPKPAQTIIDNCTEIGAFFTVADKQTPGACRIVMQGTRALELDVWVEGNTLRLGAAKGPTPAGNPRGMTAWGRELSGGDWTAATWGRGAMHNLSGSAAAGDDTARAAVVGTQAMALLNELGFAARIEKDGVRLRAVIRTVWANPPNVIADVIKISGGDILSGKATELATQIAARAPTSPFAADVEAGQGGLMVPMAMVSLAAGYVLGPRVMEMFGGGEPEDKPPAMSEVDLVSLLLRAYIEEAYPKWQAEHPKQKCPTKIEELAIYFGDNPGLPLTADPWGHDLVMECDGTKLIVYSVGPDGKPDTADDIRP